VPWAARVPGHGLGLGLGLGLASASALAFALGLAGSLAGGCASPGSAGAPPTTPSDTAKREAEERRRPGFTMVVSERDAVVSDRRAFTVDDPTTRLAFGALPNDVLPGVVELTVTHAPGAGAAEAGQAGSAAAKAGGSAVRPSESTVPAARAVVDGAADDKGGLGFHVLGATGEVVVEARYRTARITGRASTTVVLDESGTHVDVTAQITLANGAGLDFADARIALAGAGGAPPWPLPTPQTLADRRETQVVLAAARAIPITRSLVYDPVDENQVWRGAEVLRDVPMPPPERVGTTVREVGTIANTKAMGLGAAWPAGELRVLARREGGATTVMTSEQRGPVVAGEALRIPLGEAAALTGQRKVLKTSIDEDRRMVVEEVVVSVENQGTEARTVVALERTLRGEWWRLVWRSKGVSAKKDGSRVILFSLEVPAKASREVRYRLVYRW
jgi:hypothetical protein